MTFSGTVSEAVHTKSTGFLEPLDSVQPTSVTEPNQETPLAGNSLSVREHVQLLNEQKPGDVRPASQTPNNESSSYPISPFLVQNNSSLEIILSPSSNIIIEDASTPTNLNSQSIDNVATGIEIAMNYGDDLLVEEVVKSVPKGNSKHFCCQLPILLFHCFAFWFTDFVLAMPCLFLYVSLCCQHNTY